MATEPSGRGILGIIRYNSWLEEQKRAQQDIANLQRYMQQQQRYPQQQQQFQQQQQLAMGRAFPQGGTLQEIGNEWLRPGSDSRRWPQAPQQPQFPQSTSPGGQELFSQYLLAQQQARLQGGGQTQRSSFQRIADPDSGQQINALVDLNTGRIIKKYGTAEEGLSAKDKTQLAVTQAREFRADPRIKDFQIIERSERGMQSALKLATSPNTKSRIAADQALGVLFQKMLDPDSVVRESEYARTPLGAALMSRLESWIPKLLKGGLAISNEDRQALADMANELLYNAKISANKAFREFEVRADEVGLNKKVVFGNAKRFELGRPQSPTGYSQEEIDAELKRRGIR